MGEREWNILKAVKELDSVPDCNLKRLSPLYETKPVGNGYSQNFINAAALFTTGLAPGGLLILCKKIESGLGRDLDPRNRDRAIDIDIIIHGDLIMKTAHLTIPHPEFKRRAFVVVPMLRICPDIEIPGERATLAAIAPKLNLSGWARIVSRRYFTG